MTPITCLHPSCPNTELWCNFSGLYANAQLRQPNPKRAWQPPKLLCCKTKLVSLLVFCVRYLSKLKRSHFEIMWRHDSNDFLIGALQGGWTPCTPIQTLSCKNLAARGNLKEKAAIGPHQPQPSGGGCMLQDLPTTERFRSFVILTSSTAGGGGGSFKNRKPIGEICCCESRWQSKDID